MEPDNTKVNPEEKTGNAPKEKSPADVPAGEIIKGQKTDPSIHKDYDASANSGGSHSSTEYPEG